MNRKLKRVVSGVVATAILGAVPLLSASPAFAAPVLQGPATVKTANGAADLNTGDANDTWTLRLPSGAACTSDGNNGGRANTYMIPGSENPAVNLAFNGNGSLVGQSFGSAGTGTFRGNLYTTGGSPARNITLNLGDAAILNIPNLNYNVLAAGQIPSGVYNIGIACLDLDEANAVNNFWNQRITVTYPGGDAAGAQISWAVGEAAGAPVLTGVTSGDTTITAAFTHPATTPASSYTATATAQAIPACTGATSPVTTAPVGTTTPIAIGGLTNGCTYDVVVTADNGVGSPAVSNTLTGTPNPARPAVTGLVGTPGVASGSADITWSYSGPAVTGYGVSISPNEGTLGTVSGTSVTVTGLTPGTLYTATVTPTYASPPPGTPATSPTFSVNSAQNIVQHIEVNRPVGTLVLTQRCGVYGDLPIDPTSPGFPALPAAAATVDQTGTAPYLNWDPAQQQGVGTPGTNPDNPNFAEYPYPVDEDGADDILGNDDDGTVDASYPTHCGVDLGTAKLVTSGPEAGQFFAASGRLNQVTVVDTRDTDSGWTVTGTASDFTRQTGGTGSFSGNHLGWNPVRTRDSAGYDSDLDGNPDYDQNAARGATVLPRSIGAAGLKAGQPLGSAALGEGLGIATFDARLKLLIPVVNDNGRYTATLTFTIA